MLAIYCGRLCTVTPLTHETVRIFGIRLRLNLMSWSLRGNIDMRYRIRFFKKVPVLPSKDSFPIDM